MVPDLNWMKTNFEAFNNKYFEGKIPMPRFSYNCPPDCFGLYNADALCNTFGTKITKINSAGEMCFTKKYSRKEFDVQTTLLHEMIHMYCVMVLWQMPTHGRTFQSIANRINGDGWKIAEQNNLTDDDVLIDGNEIPDINDVQQQQQIQRPQYENEIKQLYLNIQKAENALSKLEQMANMNECKRLVISEKQEKQLIKALREEGNKKRSIDPSKVLLLKKKLDEKFIPLDYEIMKGGDAECIKIAGRLTPKTKQVIEKLYEEDLADWASDVCKNMFLDEKDCDDFAKLVVNRWLNNKISVHGMLDVNFY